MKFRSHACLGLMTWCFEAESIEQAQQIAEEHYQQIIEELKSKYDTETQTGGVSVMYA